MRKDMPFSERQCNRSHIHKEFVCCWQSILVTIICLRLWCPLLPVLNLY